MSFSADKRIAKRIISLDRSPIELDTSVQKIVPVLRELRGKVLEIGPGPGNLFSYLDPGVTYVGLEPNLQLHPVLQAAINKNNISAASTVVGSAEQLPFADAEFDAVVSVRSLCCMRDLDKALAEIKRVLKPGGKFVFAEHVAAPKRTWRWYLQRLAIPLWRYRAGCSPAVDIGPAIEAAGFREVHIEPFRIGGRRNIVARLRIFGTAVK